MPRSWSIAILAFLGVLAVAVALRGYRLGDDCFDCDELYAVRIQGVSPRHIAAVMARDGFHTNHPPLMTVPFLVWTAVFGATETAVRALPLAAGAVGVVAVFAFGWVIGRPWVGVFSAAMLAVNPLHITYSAEARQYALLTALLAVANVLFVLALQRSSRGTVLAYYLVAAWAALTHYFAAPVLLGHAAAAAWQLRGAGAARLPAARLLIAVGFAGLPYIAWLPVIRFQSRMKWDHLTTLSPGGVADSLIDLLGLGGWGTDVGLVLSLAALLLIALGVRAAWSMQIRVRGATRNLVPAWLGWVVLATGVLGCALLDAVFGRTIEPVARQTLAGYGYDAAIIAEEVGLLRQTGLLGFGCFAVAGIALLAWRRFEPRLATEAAPSLDDTRMTAGANVGLLLAFFLATPIVAIALLGLTGLPFHQTRNLLVLLPAVCVAWGFALERLARTPLGASAALTVVAAMTCAAGQYHAVGRFVGRDGPRLGIDTIDWREVKAWLADHDDGRAVVLVNRPATDPGMYYLAPFNPIRMPFDAAPNLSNGLAFVHLVGNSFSDRARKKLGETCGPPQRAAAGEGWEIYQFERILKR